MSLRHCLVILLVGFLVSCGTVPVPVKQAHQADEGVGGDSPQKQEQKQEAQASPQGTTNTLTGEYALAKRLYDTGRYQQAINILENSINANLETQVEAKQSEDLLVLAYTTYANSLINRGRLTRAKNILQKAVTLQPKNKALNKKLRTVENRLGVERYYKAGMEALRVGSKQAAYESFLRVIKIQPSHKKANEKIGELLPEFIDTYHKSAMSAYLKQDLDTAIKGWDKVLELDPNHELAKRYHARAVELKQRLEKVETQ